MNKYFPTRHQTITQRRINSPWITSDIMNCIRKKHRWFRIMRRGMIIYNSLKLYAEKLSLILRKAKEQYFVGRLDSLNYDVKRSWKFLNSLMGKKKHSIRSSLLTESQQTILLRFAMLSVIISLINQEISMNLSQSAPFII